MAPQAPNPSMSVTAPTTGMIAQAFSADDTISSYSQTQRQSRSAGVFRDVAGTAAGTGSATSFTASLAAGVNWAGIGVPILAVGDPAVTVKTAPRRVPMIRGSYY